jgi:hypothetical protein
LSDAAMDDANRLFSERKPAIGESPVAASNGWEFRTLLGDQAPVGLLALETAVVPMTRDDVQMIDSILPQIARIVERGVAVMQQQTSREELSGQIPVEHR